MLNPSLEAKRELRTKFMNWLFEVTGGSEEAAVPGSKFIEHAGMSHDDATERTLRDTIKYLEGEYLLRAHWTFGGLPRVVLTHPGVVEMEAALTRPDQPTEHFAPIINIMNVQGDVVGSQLQQGSPGAHQFGTFTVDQRNKAETFIQAAREAAAHPALDADDREHVSRDLDLMEKELAKPEPRWDRLKAVSVAVQTILLGGLGDALGAGITSLPWHEAIAAAF